MNFLVYMRKMTDLSPQREELLGLDKDKKGLPKMAGEVLSPVGRKRKHPPSHPFAGKRLQ